MRSKSFRLVIPDPARDRVNFFRRGTTTTLKRISLFAFLLASFLFHPSAHGALQAPDPPQAATETTQVETLLALANDFAQRQFDNQRALALYSEALALESTNDEILWRISRTCVDIANHMPSESDEEKEDQLKMYEKALEFANKSVEANPANSMSYTRRAVATGRISLFRGMWTVIGLLKDMREDLEMAISLDSANHAALYALGKTHMKVIERPLILRWPLGLGWGSREEAIRNFERAIALRGDLVAYRLACARAYADEGELEKAREHLSAIASLPNLGEDDEMYRTDAKELLEKVENELKEEEVE